MTRIPMTVRGQELLKQELRTLKSDERQKVIADIAEARSHGDLSENAEYDAARERQSFVEGRIQEIESRLSLAQVIDPKTLNAGGRCVFGSTVALLDLKTNEELRYQLVGEDEANVKNNLLSFTSPIAKSIIGKSEGDEAEVATPNGARVFEILSVEYI